MAEWKMSEWKMAEWKMAEEVETKTVNKTKRNTKMADI